MGRLAADVGIGMRQQAGRLRNQLNARGATRTGFGGGPQQSGNVMPHRGLSRGWFAPNIGCDKQGLVDVGAGGTEPRCAASRGLPARHGIKRVDRRLRCGPERREPSGCTHGDGSVVGSAQGGNSRSDRLLGGAGIDVRQPAVRVGRERPVSRREQLRQARRLYQELALRSQALGECRLSNHTAASGAIDASQCLLPLRRR